MGGDVGQVHCGGEGVHSQNPHDARSPQFPHDDEEELQEIQQQHIQGHWDAPAQ